MTKEDKIYRKAHVEMYERYLAPPEKKEFWDNYERECLEKIERERLHGLSFVKIKQEVYENIFAYYFPAPPEQGGILGMKDGIVCEYIHDNSKQGTECAVYIPNTEFLNLHIQNWANKDIDFCGIVHSHPNEQNTLSSSDLEYIKQLFQMNPWLEQLYFPLVVEDYDMIVYVADMQDGQLLIHKAVVEIVD